MGAPPTTERGRLTRQRIVSAAAEVVAEKGAAGASLIGVNAILGLGVLVRPRPAASSTTTSTTRTTCCGPWPK